MKYLIAIDIGGTTFNCGLFSQSFKLIDISTKDKIRNYSNKNDVVCAMINQINSLIKSNKINKKNILGIGIASPGPLDSNNGIILETPNLRIFKNYKITEEFKRILCVDCYLENDANLFSLGEWYSSYKNNNILVGMTIGTGLGFGLVINGKLYTGAHGMSMEYGLAPFNWGIAEKKY